jgi:surfeit locus 1 family protein
LLERVLERKLEGRIVLLDAQQSDGFERIWAMRAGFGPERHLGYAVQWFALAATMFIVFLVMSFKSKASA